MALTDKLTAIADAIRAKTGKSDSLTLDQMPTEIANITGGGGSSADVRYVTFTNPATGETFVKPVAVGDDCVDVVAKGLWATPTQESTAQYDYAFANSWSAEPNGSSDANILNNITEDKTVYAVFTATLRYYTITWMDEDGTTLKTESKAYGSVPSYTPTKDGYKFEGWTPALSPVTGDATYTAAWKEVTGGSCGTNATWLLEDGVLTISGTGTITAKGATSYPWYPNINIIKEVIIEDGITEVPSEAFYAYTKLEKVTIGDTVAVIDTGAFQSCDILSDVTLGSGLTEMGQRVFNGCSKLTTITIPASVTLMDARIFSTTLKSAIFENPNGWWWAYNTGNTSGEAISATDLSDPSKAATLLHTTHKGRVWRRS